MRLPTFKNNCDGKLPFTNLLLTNKCPHRCIYCIANHTSKEKEVPININDLAEKAIKLKNSCVVIEGGEPLLYPEEVNKLIDLLNPHIKYVSLFTSLPENINTKENKILFKQIISKISRCTISIASSDPIIAADIMRTKIMKWRMDFIKELIDEGYANNFRVSFLLCKGYIDTAEQVKKELETLINIGVKDIKIGEIALEPDLFIGVKDIFPDIKLGDPIYHGCQTNLTKKILPKALKDLDFKNCKYIVIKRICAITTKGLYHYTLTNKEKFKLILRNYRDILFKFKKFNILYNNGIISNSWNKRRTINEGNN